MQRKLNSRLSNKLFFAVMGTAMLLGLLLSVVQIMLDARTARKALEQSTQEILAMMREPATQAAFNLDRIMAQQVVEGLFQNQAVFYAAISIPGEPPLASAFRDKQRIRYRSLMNSIFGQDLSYSLELKGYSPTDNTSIVLYGNLEVSIDPSNAALDFLERSQNLFISGLLQAIFFGSVLYLIFQGLIARPMTTLLGSLEDIDPMRPSQSKLDAPLGHEDDELGAWVHKINDLFKAIEKYNSKRRVAEAHVERLSNYDMLTELPNRNMLLRRIESSIQDANNQNDMFAVLYCALDDFKSVNLLHSYHAGDKLLLMMADRFRSELDPAQTVARVGGDVFAIVLPGLISHYQAADVAQRILDNVRRPFRLDNNTIKVSATIGITMYPHDAATAEQLLKNAENVMQLAKSEGGNRYQFYVANVDQKIRAAKVLEKQLATAVDDGQLELVFQPQVNLLTGEVRGAEALVRWHHPERGLVPPNEFIPLAERTGAIVAIGEWVLQTSCQYLRKWHGLGITHLTISVNVSPVQLHQSDIVNSVRAALEASAVPPHYLVLELTETAVMDNVDSAIRLLKQIKALGVQLAIDDFGTGYSSLSYLKKMPMDEIKIDRTFVQDMLEDPDNGTIVDAIIQLGHSLNLSVIAEGTETLDQIRYLQECECDMAQGYYYSQPLSEAAFIALLQEQRGQIRNATQRAAQSAQTLLNK
ncbi:MAG: EAL domain-containing protein [Gammaproteobacteria bacterium]|nr:EAL domain-containing protein [Gammaproteobacteria bacterium]